MVRGGNLFVQPLQSSRPGEGGFGRTVNNRQFHLGDGLGVKNNDSSRWGNDRRAGRCRKQFDLLLCLLQAPQLDIQNTSIDRLNGAFHQSTLS